MEKKIGQLITFIEREAGERVAEIDATADDEFHDTVYQLVNLEKKKVKQTYEKMEKAVLKANVLAEATVKNAARLRMSRLRSEILSDVFEKASVRLVDGLKRETRLYRVVMKQLLLQSLTKILAPKVLVRVLEKDLGLIKGFKEEVRREYEAVSLLPCEIRLDAKYFLSETDFGGVVVYATTGQKKVVNTLKYRVELIREKMVPAVRYHLFGPNPVRKFFD